MCVCGGGHAEVTISYKDSVVSGMVVAFPDYTYSMVLKFSVTLMKKAPKGSVRVNQAKGEGREGNAKEGFSLGSFVYLLVLVRFLRHGIDM